MNTHGLWQNAIFFVLHQNICKIDECDCEEGMVQYYSIEWFKIGAPTLVCELFKTPLFSASLISFLDQQGHLTSFLDHMSYVTMYKV